MAVLTWILGLVTASLIPIVYFIWQINDRNSKQTDKVVSSSVETAVQAEKNRSNLAITELQTRHELNMLKHRVMQLEKFLDSTTNFHRRCLPGDEDCDYESK